MGAKLTHGIFFRKTSSPNYPKPFSLSSPVSKISCPTTPSSPLPSARTKMPVFSVSMGSVTGYLSHLFKAAASHTHSSSFSLAYPLKLPKFSLCKNPLHCNAKLAASSAENTDQASAATGVIDLSSDMIRPARFCKEVEVC